MPIYQGSSAQGSPKPPRSKKACDLCRQRKVKCRIAEGEAECQGCRDLGVACTRYKPRRRRGPPSRHVLEQIKAISTQQEPTVVASPTVAVDSPSQAVARSSQLAASPRESWGASSSPSNPSTRSLGSILTCLGPRGLIRRVLLDWFKIVHPLGPVLHRQHLFQRIHDHWSESSPVLAALVLSTCAVTVSTLRRQSFDHYPSITVEKCIGIIEDADLLRPQPISVDWCIAWYHIASATLVDGGSDNYRSYRAIREAMTGVHWLLGYRAEEHNWKEKEILKRLYWLFYMWQVDTFYRAAEVRGQAHLTFLPINPDLEHLRPKDLTDRELYPELASTPDNPSWPEDDLHFVSGLNGLIDTFLVWAQGQADMTHRDPEDSLRRATVRIQGVLDGLPPELRWSGRLTRFPRGEWCHQVQMVNILITALWLKSNFLQHLGSLLPGLAHRDIASDVLEILDNLPHLIFEANGHSVVYKLRDIGAAYLAEVDMAATGGLAENQEQQEMVRRLLRNLEHLDFRPPPDESVPRTVETT